MGWAIPIVAAVAGGAASGAMSNQGGGSPSPYGIGDSTEQIYKSRIRYDPMMAKSSYDILTNPDYGTGSLTKYLEEVRRQQYPNETNVRDILTQNILQSLQSPTGITPEQQAALTTRRGEAQNELTKALNTQGNLGGGLYGGTQFNRVADATRQLQNQFSEQDISRDQTNRNNAIASAMPLLQLLYPGSQITSPNFQSVVPSADTAYSGAINTRGQDLAYQAQQQANNNALYSSLFSGLGQGVGAYYGSK
jgi:hypothetical protein